MVDPGSISLPDVRVRVFVDYWNFALSMRRWDPDFSLDWKSFGPWLSQQAGILGLDQAQHGRIRYEGLHVYTSYNPKDPKSSKFRKWAMDVVDRFPGVQVVMKEQKPKKSAPACPQCYASVDVCPKCAASMIGNVEKGVDTALVTDMIKLAWEEAYDIGILVSADRDFIPAVEFLDGKGIKVIHAGFAPNGMDLARKCWASFDLKVSLQELNRPRTAAPNSG